MTVLTAPDVPTVLAAIEENEAKAIVRQARALPLDDEEGFTYCHVTVADRHAETVRSATGWLLLPNPEVPEGFAVFYIPDREMNVVAKLEAIEV